MVHPLNLLHTLTPFLGLPPVLALFFPSTPPPPLLPGIRPIIARRVFPRCNLILALLALAAASYAADGLVFAVCVALTGRWDGDMPIGGGDAHGGEEGSTVGGWAWVVFALGGTLVWGGAALLVVWQRAYERRALIFLAGVAVVNQCVTLVYTVLDAVHGA